MTKKNIILTDEELAKLLDMASGPKVPLGFEQRMARRLSDAGPSNILPFPQPARQTPPEFWRWQMPAVLAASLVFGIWLGTQGTLSGAIASVTDTAMFGSTQDFNSADLEDIANLVAESAS